MFGLFDYIKAGLGALAGGFLVFVVMYGVVIPIKKYEARKQGSAEVVQQVTKRNEQAGKLAREAKQGVDACYDANGTWDQETGKCALPVQ